MIRHIMIATLVFAAIIISFFFDDPANAGGQTPSNHMVASISSGH